MQAKVNPAGLGQLRVLVVEDNEHMRILIRTLLKAFGIRDVQECTEGGQALRALKENIPDFVLVDLAMAPMDGLQLTRSIRASEDPLESVLPIILVTAYTERRRIEAARDAGVNEIVAKPVTPAALFQRIEEIVLRPRLFVRTATYHGPCRRRHTMLDYAGPWRRKDDIDRAAKMVEA